MGQALFVFIVVVIVGLAIAVPVAFTIAIFLMTRALVAGERRLLAGIGLAGALVVAAYGLASFSGGVSDTRCSSEYGGGRNVEGASIEQSSGLWPPGLRCRYGFSDGSVETYRPDFGAVWVAAAMTAVFGAAMGVAVVGRRFSKKGDMLF